MSTRVRVGTAAAASAVVALAVTSCTGPGVTTDDFAALRGCESSGNYFINTGNGYYGAYQFDLPTWEGLGFSGLPNLNNPATQDAAAYKLYDERGWAPWPTCSMQLGLQDDGPAPATPVIPPQWDGTYLSNAMAGEQRADVLAWQTQMYDAGFTIMPKTGYFDTTTAGVATFLGMLANVNDGDPGVVGPNLWAAGFIMWHG